jgi:hypothetical protein
MIMNKNETQRMNGLLPCQTKPKPYRVTNILNRKGV